MINWEKAEENDLGVETVAFEPVGTLGKFKRTIGLNGILKGDEVLYKDEKFNVVMVSRLGDFGLSRTGDLPYILRVRADQVEKI